MPNLAGCLLIMNRSQKSHVTLQFCSHMTFWKRYISSTTSSMPPKGWEVALYKARRHFCFVVTLQRFHFYLHFHVAYVPWDWLRMREHHLKNLQFTWHFHHLTNWKRYAQFFLVQSNSSWFLTLLICIPTVHKPIHL